MVPILLWAISLCCYWWCCCQHCFWSCCQYIMDFQKQGLHKYQVANLLTNLLPNLLCQSSRCGEGKKCLFSFCHKTSYPGERYLFAIGAVSSIFTFPLQHMSHSIERLRAPKHSLPNIVF